jgi:integrase
VIIPQDVAKITYESLRDALVADYQFSGRRSLYVGADDKPRITATCHLDIFSEGFRAPVITTDAIDKFKLERQAAGEAAATTNRALSALKRMFHLARRAGKVQNIPYISMLKENGPRKGFLELEQFRLLRQHLPERLRPLVTLAYYSGMRSAELKRLRWNAVDLEGGLLRLYADETKSGEPRLVPLNQETRSMIAMLPHGGDDAYVFGGIKPVGSFRKAWATACRRAELQVLFHDLRRSGVRNLRRAGVTEGVAMKISGHKTRTVFERYNIVGESDLRDAVKKLDAFLESEWVSFRVPRHSPSILTCQFRW